MTRARVDRDTAAYHMARLCITTAQPKRGWSWPIFFGFLIAFLALMLALMVPLHNHAAPAEDYTPVHGPVVYATVQR